MTKKMVMETQEKINEDAQEKQLMVNFRKLSSEKKPRLLRKSVDYVGLECLTPEAKRRIWRAWKLLPYPEEIPVHIRDIVS